jgi:hypothetical protein
MPSVVGVDDNPRGRTGYGVLGQSTDRVGVRGESDYGEGVRGESDRDVGVYGCNKQGGGLGRNLLSAGVNGESTGGIRVIRCHGEPSPLMHMPDVAAP